ncbi:MAG: DUF368 domain-containing protein [Ruminococcaceae bacterium]|nr:DUF368 domain-containing protein [Oscillospiraceae bacterium]
MKKSHNIKVFAKGAVIGGSMLLPGLSGGTLAILLGIYDKLIKSVSDITKRIDIKRNLLFLCIFSLGGLIGAISFSHILSSVLSLWGFYLSFLFMGAVIGTVPVIYKQSGADRLSLKDVLSTAIGVMLSVSINLIPENVMNISDINSFSEFLLLFIAGIFIAIALILPGISVSYTLLILGIYQRVIDAVKNLDILYILPIAFGCVVGILGFTRLLDYLMTKFTRSVYMIISGFVISCIPRIFPGLPTGVGYLIAIPLLIVGFWVVYSVAGKAQKNFV